MAYIEVILKSKKERKGVENELERG